MTTARKRVLVALASTAVAAMALSGCAGSGGGESDGDTLVLGSTADITGWSPADQPSYQSWPIEAVYDTLVRCQPGGDLAPGIAESWEISEDRRSFTANLRGGVELSDGTPLDAEAVEASFAYLAEINTDRYAGITFDAPDPQTITITWPDAQPLMNLRVCLPYLSGAEYIEAGDFSAPLGSGPYTLDSGDSTTGSVYAFTKNAEYWDADSFPYENVEVRVLTDETAALNALKTGQIDGTIISAGSYDEAERADLDIISDSAGMTMLHLTDRLGEKIPALGNVDVRRAMNMVLDKQSIVNDLYRGHATPISQPFLEGSAAYIDGLDPYPFDIEAAQQLMRDAGFEDGFTFTVPVMEGQAWTVMLPYVKQQLALLNITVEEETLSGPDAITNLLSGDYPVPLWNVGGLNAVEDTTVHVLSTGFWNVSHQPNETIDALWQKVVVGDEEQQADALQEINQYVVDQAWFVPILTPENFYAHGDRVTINQSSDPFRIHPRLRDFQ